MSFTNVQFKHPLKKELSKIERQAESTSGIFKSLDDDADYRFEAEETESDNEDSADGNSLYLVDFKVPSIVIEYQPTILASSGFYYKSLSTVPLFIKFRNLRL